MLLTSQRPPHVTLTKGDYVITWIETHCVYTMGELAGQQVQLLGWEKAFIRRLFLVHGGNGRRWYRWALLGIPKKNGKTELAAWLGLYFLIGDEEPTPYVGVGASADHQADLAFSAVKRCAEWSPTLHSVVKAYDKTIEVPSIPAAKMVRLTKSGGTNDGPNWSALIIDELHEVPRDFWTVTTNGIGGRLQPMVLQITTAGFDLETVCGEQYELGLRLVDDWEIDPRYLFWWYQPEDEFCDYKDPEIWRDVNPSWGATLPEPELYLTDQVRKKKEAEFRRYFLNQWTLAEDVWLGQGMWDMCEDEDRQLDPDLPLFVGIDGALKRDSMAITALQPQADGVDVVRGWVWQNPYPPGHTGRDRWKLNLQEPMKRLRKLRKRFPEPAMMDDDDFPIEGPAFGYDPFAMELLASNLEDEGLNMVTVGQTDQRMCPAAERLYERIVTQKLAHNGDAVMKRQVHSAVMKVKERGWRLSRPEGTRKNIDAAISMAMAAYLALVTEAYDDSGFEIW